MQWPTSQTRMKGGQPCAVGNAGAYSSFFRLPFGIEHQHVPGAAGAALAARCAVVGGKQVVLRGDAGDFFFLALPAALLGFQHEGIALVEIDAADRVAFVAMARHHALEHIVIVLVGGLSRVRLGQAEQGAKLSEEERVIGALLSALLALPAGDKGVDAGGESGGDIATRYATHAAREKRCGGA